MEILSFFWKKSVENAKVGSIDTGNLSGARAPECRNRRRERKKRKERKGKGKENNIEDKKGYTEDLCSGMFWK